MGQYALRRVLLFLPTLLFATVMVCQELGAHTLRGVAEQVQMYQILGESAAQSRLEVAGSSGFPPLIGCEAEVTLLLERWAQSTAGQGQVVLLSGEAGIGKSRLVEVLRQRVASAGAQRLVFRCSPYHTSSALYPVIEQVQRVLQWQRDDALVTKLDALEQVLQPYGLPLPEVVPLLAALLSVPLLERYPPLTLSPQRQRQQTLETLVAWFLAVAEQQPVLGRSLDAGAARSDPRSDPHGPHAHLADVSSRVSTALDNALVPGPAHPRPLESTPGRGHDRTPHRWQRASSGSSCADCHKD